MLNFYKNNQSKNILATNPGLVEVTEVTKNGIETTLLLLAKHSNKIKIVAYINMYNKNNVRSVGEVFANRGLGKLIYSFALMKSYEDGTALTREPDGNTEDAALNIWREIASLKQVTSKNNDEQSFSWLLCEEYFEDMMENNDISENKHNYYFGLLRSNFKKSK